MLRSTFLGYKTATSALRVNQNMMDIVGQNISNINTEGYTRQRLDINSVSFSSSNIKLGTTGVIIGQGVKATGVSQYRDAFLDLRYRMEAAKSGSKHVESEALSDLESVFDEITKEGLDAQFSDLIQQLHSLTSSPSDPVLEGVVRTSAQILTQMFNDYSKQIKTIKNQQLNYLQDGAVVKVNQLLDNIATLNKQIKEDNIGGNPALELTDERNMLIDELSNYLDIEVEITPKSIGGNRSIDLLSIKLRDVKPPLELVNDEKSAEIVLNVPVGNEVQLNIKKIDGTIENNINDKISNGQLDGYLKFLNGSGEFATTSSDNKGVVYYEKMLDTLASKFAEIMNEANSTSVPGAPYNKPLFEARKSDPSDPDTITAANIKISDEWLDSTGSYITNTKVATTGDSSGATDNILKMISKFESKETFKTDANIDLFEGTFQEFLSFTTTRLNLQVDDVQTSLDTYSESQYQIDYARSSMSSVDLNEEGVNLLQYSKSYNAAARLMTTLDEMLDTLINRMGV